MNVYFYITAGVFGIKSVLKAFFFTLPVRIYGSKIMFFFVGENGSADIVKLLFDHGLEFNEPFNETSLKERGVTPLQLACEYC